MTATIPTNTLEPKALEAAREAYIERLPFGLREGAKGADALHDAIADSIRAYLSTASIPQAAGEIYETIESADTVALRMLANDPNAVHVNLLRGSMARPSVAQIVHIYGEDALRAALAVPAPEAPGHTDLMVSPEAIDAFIDKHLPPDDDLIERARKASEMMTTHEAWEMPAPLPEIPVNYGWTAQVIDDLAARLALLTAERDEAREARDRAERNRDMWKGQCERQAQFSSALAEVEAARPGAFWALAKGRVSEAEPLYGFQILFGTDEVLASGEGDSIEVAIRAARKALANEEGG